MRRKRKLKLTGFAKICMLAATAVISYQLVCLSLPYLQDGLSGVMVVAAGLSYPSGGKALLEEELAEGTQVNPEDYEDPAEEVSSQPEVSQPEESEAEEEVSKPTTDGVRRTFADQTNPPKQTEDSYEVKRRDMSPDPDGDFVALSPGFINNKSDLSDKETAKAASQKINFRFEDTSEPQVLIYHTHATESYLNHPLDWYDEDFTFHSDDNEENLVAVGTVLEEQLEAAGIGVIHDGNQYDNPTYTGAYSRSRVTIEEYLSEYPSIKVVLDLHRDAIQEDDGTAWAPVVNINGEDVAQMMIISCADDGSGDQPNYRENLAFASTLQRQMETDFPGLTRAILFSRRSYNQELSPGALLVEVGSHGNTLAEAKRAITLFGESLLKVLQ